MLPILFTGTEGVPNKEVGNTHNSAVAYASIAQQESMKAIYLWLFHVQSVLSVEAVKYSVQGQNVMRQIMCFMDHSVCLFHLPPYSRYPH